MSHLLVETRHHLTKEPDGEHLQTRQEQEYRRYEEGPSLGHDRHLINVLVLK